MYYSLLQENGPTGLVKIILNRGKWSGEAQMQVTFAPKTSESLLWLNDFVEVKPVERLEKQQNFEVTCIEIASLQDKLLPGQILLPSCLVCLSRLDRSVIGFTPLSCRDLYHFCCRQQCAKMNATCLVCRAIESESQLACTDCASRGDLWICLVCGNVGCGRYRGGHAHDHFEKSCHAFALQVDSHHVWDYFDDRYVHRTIRLPQGTVAIEASSPPPSVLEEEESFSAELTCAQLESQKAFFDERLREQEAYFRKMMAKRESEFAEEQEKLRQELRRLQQEQTLFSELKNRLQSRYEETKQRCEQYKRDYEAEQLISTGLCKSNQELREQLAESANQCTDLQEQLADLLKHLETLQLVAQTGFDPEIVNGRIITAKKPVKGRVQK